MLQINVLHALQERIELIVLHQMVHVPVLQILMIKALNYVAIILVKLVQDLEIQAVV